MGLVVIIAVGLAALALWFYFARTRKPVSTDVGPPVTSAKRPMQWETSALLDLAPEEKYILPSRYEKDRLVLLARDPRWIYAYWELTRARHKEVFDAAASRYLGSRPILRFYDLSLGSRAGAHFDVALQDSASNWYVKVDCGGRRIRAELGRLGPGGFAAYLQSNEVILPPEHPASGPDDVSSGARRAYGSFLHGGRPTSPRKWGC